SDSGVPIGKWAGQGKRVGRGNGIKGKGSIRKGQKVALAAPVFAWGHAHAVPAATQGGSVGGSCCRLGVSSAADPAAVGFGLVGDSSPARLAGANLAADVAFAPAVRRALPGAARALRRAGTAVAGLGDAPPCLSGRYAGSRTRD